MNPKHYFSMSWGIYLALLIGLSSFPLSSNNSFSDKTAVSLYEAKNTASMVGPSEVSVTVIWNTYASAYKVEVYDPSDNLLTSICNPSNCFNGLVDDSYTTTVDLGCLANGLGYYVRMFDTADDGWNGVNNSVSIQSGGVEVMIDNGTTATLAGTDVGFEVSGGGATCCDMTSTALIVSTCNNEGTIGFTTDDTFTFSLNPAGTNLGSTYSISGDITQSGISYGSATTFDNGGNGFLLSGGNLSITITDDVSGSCQLIETVTAPSACPTCTIAAPTPQRN